MIDRAKKIVADYMHANFPDAQYTSFVTWQAKILQNFKCMIATTQPYGMYFEATFDGDKKRWYLDVYRKIENVEITHV